jgi:hypothetical protein
MEHSIHPHRISIATAALTGGASTFLPWFHLSAFVSINGTSGSLFAGIPVGYFTIALFAVALVVAMAGTLSRPLGNTSRILCFASGAGAIGVVIWRLTDIYQSTKVFDDLLRASPMGEVIRRNIQIGVGVYVLILCGGAICVLSCLFRGK